MTKGLQMLEIIKQDEDIRDNGAYVPILRSIEKELKALEIIKEHIKVDKFKYESEETYGLTEYMFFISKEEYELLKEVLL